jgi:purine-nucleoside phosphorylase
MSADFRRRRRQIFFEEVFSMSKEQRVEYRQHVEEATAFVARNVGFVPHAAVVLGSGLGSVAEAIENPVVIPYGEIPHWPLSTAPGHKGRLVAGYLKGVPVVAMQGRLHYYEGYSMREITFPVRVFGGWGTEVFFATNASGGVHYGLLPGDLVLVADHINLMGANPLFGPNEDDWGPRFPDMTLAYDKKLMTLAEEVALRESVNLKRGVYIAFAGPSFETPAEIRMARVLGADLVGMSTVPEIIVARHMGMRILAVSCVANYAAGMTESPLTHQEVLDEMGRAADRLTRLVVGVVASLGEEGR